MLLIENDMQLEQLKVIAHYPRAYLHDASTTRPRPYFKVFDYFNSSTKACI